MGLLSAVGRIPQRLRGVGEVMGGRVQSGIGQTMHNVVRPSDYRGPLPEWAPIARKGVQMIDDGVSMENRGYARQVAMDIRARADAGDVRGATQMLEELKRAQPGMANEVELILMQTSGR